MTRAEVVDALTAERFGSPPAQPCTEPPRSIDSQPITESQAEQNRRVLAEAIGDPESADLYVVELRGAA